MVQKFNHKDLGVKTSPYYIRQKVEIGKMFEAFCAWYVKVGVMIVLVIYMYGAMCLKYASGAKSFVSAVSFIFYDDLDEWGRRSSFNPYYIAVMIFAALSLMFSFGNIENSKML